MINLNEISCLTPKFGWSVSKYQEKIYNARVDGRVSIVLSVDEQNG